MDIHEQINRFAEKERRKERTKIIRQMNNMIELIKNEKEDFGKNHIIPYFNKLRRWFELDSYPIARQSVGEKDGK